MTEQEINAAIAEACGWAEIKRRATGIRLNELGYRSDCEQIPNYVGDLNAMHEAEKGLEDPDCYEEWLADVCGGTSYLFHATARQRAQAFLRTIGKWEGD
jgi:hypothetical protein